MKFFILGLFALLMSAETFAQVRGPRYNPPGGGRHDRYDDRRPGPGPGPGRYDRYDRYDDRRPGPVIVGPRYSPRRDSGRIIRTTRRSPVIWSSGFGYQCAGYMNDQLILNGRLVHVFRYSGDCFTALSDIRVYGDFCDQEDLYDQSGRLEAQFTFNYECRNALGYYY